MKYSALSASMDTQNNGQEQDIPGTTEQEAQPEETIHIHYFPDAIVILKEEDQAQVVDSAPVLPQKTSFLTRVRDLCFLPLPHVSLYRVSSVLHFQPANRDSHHYSQITDSYPFRHFATRQSITTSHHFPITDRSHNRQRPPERKSGNRIPSPFITANFNSVTIAAGTIFTGANGIQIVTDQDATIPAANPPVFGQLAYQRMPYIQGDREIYPHYDINRGLLRGFSSCQ